MTEMECHRELSMLKYRMGLVDEMFANGLGLSWWVAMYGHIVDRFVAMAEAWTVLKKGETNDIP